MIYELSLLARRAVLFFSLQNFHCLELYLHWLVYISACTPYSTGRRWWRRAGCELHSARGWLPRQTKLDQISDITRWHYCNSSWDTNHFRYQNGQFDGEPQRENVYVCMLYKLRGQGFDLIQWKFWKKDTLETSHFCPCLIILYIEREWSIVEVKIY